jgi:hypothetical protein
MRKTTIYLGEEEAEALRKLADATGRSQADLIREAVRQVVASRPPRRFRSLGKGQGPGGPTPRWDAADVYAKVFPEPD